MTNTALWTITLNPDDVARFQFVQMVARVDELTNEAVWLRITPNGERKWVASAHNVLMWGSVYSSTDKGIDALVPVTPLFMHAVSQLISDHVECTLSLEHDGPTSQVLVARADNSTVVCDCPVASPPEFDFDPKGHVNVNLTGEDLQQLATVIGAWPMYMNVSEYPNFLPPFAHMRITRNSISCTLNWRRYGGNAATVSLPATSSGDAFVSFESPVIGRAMSLLYDEGDFQLTIDPENAPVFYVHNPSWGFAVTVRRECVARWGQRVIDALEAQGAEASTAWSNHDAPALPVLLHGHHLTVLLIEDSVAATDTLRIAYRLSENSPTHPDFLCELMQFNERLVAAKCMVQDGQLFVVADIPLTHPDMDDDIAQAARRVVSYGDLLQPALMVYAFS
ncbi:MAG: hypothetical protein FJW98_04165 [Actinobacteria bacterium]|nr:hypothetical protein [Actinomycetota bacterium]